MTPTKLVVDLIGWLGATLLLLAYALVSFKKLTGDSRPYQILNGLGGCGLIVNTWYYHSYPSSFVNFVWILIAIAALLRAGKASAAAGS
jgi:hypothetical protein